MEKNRESTPRVYTRESTSRVQTHSESLGRGHNGRRNNLPFWAFCQTRVNRVPSINCGQTECVTLCTVLKINRGLVLMGPSLLDPPLNGDSIVIMKFS